MRRFAAFILTHGRPGNVKTYHSLRRAGYTGPIYIIVDDTDKTVDEYRARFGEQVVVFDKRKASETFDHADNFSNFKAIIYARNASFDIAERLGLTHFIQLDDDYTRFSYCFDRAGNYIVRAPGIKNLDAVLESLLDYYDSIDAATICMVQGGDLLGGQYSSYVKHDPKVLRKAMNSFICRTDRRFTFVGTINEDVNTYVLEGSRGKLFLSIPLVRLFQVQTQKSAGGMTETYLDSGTYVKSFYTVMHAPSCVKIRMMGPVHGRLHHSIAWEHAVPMIVSESLRKPDA